MAANPSSRAHDSLLLQRLLDRQQYHWRRGEGMLVETLVKANPLVASDRQALLILLCNEWELRASAGETPTLEEYQKRFPDLADDLRKRFEVFAALRPMDTAPESQDPTPSGGEPVPPPTLMPPSEIKGYEIVGVLGQGGMGIVYKAKQMAAGRVLRVVALKMIRGGFGDDEARDRFRTEAHAVAAMQHPNIVQIFEVGADGSQPFFSLEFCGGSSLESRLKPSPLPPKEAARTVETLARAMQHAHDHGVIHRDLKPANVLLMEDGTPKITDFGLAKKLEDVGRTQTGVVMGTPSYMPPEQAAGRKKEIGPAADVYALGAILYECLTGRPPFKAATTFDTLIQVLHDDPVPPRQLQPKTPRDLETICLKCLEKQPGRRYATARDLAEDLRRFQEDKPIIGRPVGRLERTWRWGRRNPKDASLIAAGLLALVLGAVAYFWISGVEQQRRQQQQTAEQDRRVGQAKATTKAEDYANQADQLWEQAKAAPSGDLLPWEKAFQAARRAKDVSEANVIDEPTSRHVEETWAGVKAAKQDAETLAALQNLALSQMQLTKRDGKEIRDSARISAEYEKVFRNYCNLDLSQLEEAKDRIRASKIKAQLVAALEAWIPLRPDEEARRQLKGLADDVSEPDEFHSKLREALVTNNRMQLKDLALVDISALPPHVVYAVATALINSQDYDDAVSMLAPAQRRWQGDFGINFQLAYCLVVRKKDDEQGEEKDYEDAIWFFKMALACRKEDAKARSNLGFLYWRKGDLVDAEFWCREAIQRDAQLPDAHVNLAAVLWDKADPKDLKEVVSECQIAIGLDDNYAVAHHDLGSAFMKQGKLPEAVKEFRKATRLDDGVAETHDSLASYLQALGILDEAAQEFQKAIRGGIDGADRHYFLGLALWQQGKLDKDTLWQFEQAYDQLVMVDSDAPPDRKFRIAYNFGDALVEIGYFERAQEIGDKAAKLFAAPDPRHEMAKDLADRAGRLHDLESGLPLILTGDRKPQDAGQADDMAWLCHAKERFAASARLCERAFTLDKALAESSDGMRTFAARMAALAGCKKGLDAGKLTDEECAHFRKQALAWIQADFEAMAEQAKNNDPQVRHAAARRLRIWLCHVDFVGVRDEAEMNRLNLPESEQEVWRQFWEKVAKTAEQAEQ